MTEQEFRERLKRAARNDGLSPEHQARVLAWREGEEQKVGERSNMKYILAVILVVVLGTATAVAAGSLYVGWDAEGVVPGPIYDWESSMDDKAIALASERPDDEAWHIGWPMTETEPGGGMFFGEAKINFSTLEEAAQLLIEDAYLPWIQSIPEGYTFQRGYAEYRPMQSYEHIGTEEIDGFEVERARIPEEQRIICRYNLTFAKDDAQKLYIDVQLGMGDGTGRVFLVGEGGSAERLVLTGVQDALLRVLPDGTKSLSVLKWLAEPVCTIGYTAIVYPDCDQYMEFGCVDLGASINDNSVTEDDLLAIFGLEAQ